VGAVGAGFESSSPSTGAAYDVGGGGGGGFGAAAAGFESYTSIQTSSRFFLPFTPFRDFQSNSIECK